MRFSGIAAGFAVLAFTGISPAAPPTLDALYPAGGQAGSEPFAVTLSGKSDPWPCKTWCSNPKISLTADPEKKAQLTVSIAKDAPTGPCLVRIFNAEGVSEPRIFVVGANAEIREDEKQNNDNPSTPQVIEKLPVVINGRLEKSQDVDAYRISLKKGQPLIAHLDGYSLKSGIDPFLHLYDPNGNRILLENDNPRNLDPRLDCVAAQDGDYALAVMAIASPPNANVTFHGAATAVYRLTIATDPKAAPPKFDPAFPAKDAPPPNAALVPPVDLAGTLSKPGEVDRITFTGKKGENHLIRVAAFKHGFPTDPVLTVLKADGTLLRAIDDIKPDVDAEYPYRIPADGDYSVEVSDRFKNGGPDFRYRLTINLTTPDFTVSVDKTNLVLGAGESGEMKVKVTRTGGHTVPLKIETDPLPAGVTVSPAEVPEKGGDVVIKFEAAKEAAPANQPLRIRVVETEGETPKKVEAAFSFQDSTARGPYLIQETADLWLTVKKAAEKKEEKAEAAK